MKNHKIQEYDSDGPFAGHGDHSQHQSRRTFLADVPKLLTGTAVGAGLLGATAGSSEETFGQEGPTFPWPYVELDPELVGNRAYAGYNSGRGCMYGAFEGLIGELRERVGVPYTSFPVGMMEYGKGGVNGVWGTLCGALNASGAAINLVCTTPAPLINEVYFWYSQEMLPLYTPPTPKFDTARSIAGSPLCHASVQNWCAVTGFKPTSSERAERCACLTASVAKHTAELLNKHFAGTFAATHALSSESKRCLTCHGKGAQENVNQGGNMGCVQCHSEIDQLHPQRHLMLRWTGQGSLENADAVAGPWAPALNQEKTQALPLNEAAKFFRIR